MNSEDRIAAFEKLGKYIHSIDKVEFQEIAQRAQNENPWFTPDSVRQAFTGLTKYLDRGNLDEWIARYNLTPGKPKVIAVVMAGNIPLVGFHDLLSVLISGHIIQIKPSSKDTFLLTYFLKKL